MIHRNFFLNKKRHGMENDKKKEKNIPEIIKSKSIIVIT